MDVIDQIERTPHIKIHQVMPYRVSMGLFSEIDINEYEKMECALATQLYIRTTIEK